MLRFSVIIPAYNCADTIEDTVSSVLLSGLKDFEIIIVNDGSRDGTAEICDGLSAQFENISVIHQENAGVSAARNAGLRASRGEYIWFFDADDSVDENAACHAAEELENCSVDMLIFGMSFDYYFKGRNYRRDELSYKEQVYYHFGQWNESFEELYECNMLSSVCNKFIKRETLLENAISFDYKVFEMEDFIFSVECLESCETVCIIPDVIYRYKQAEDEKSTYNRLCRIKSLTEYMKPFENVMEKLRQSLKSRGIEMRENTIVEQIYTMLLQGQISLADAHGIKAACEDMFAGKYADTVKERCPELYDDIINGRFEKIRFRRIKTGIRHYAAVRYKYLRSFL